MTSPSATVIEIVRRRAAIEPTGIAYRYLAVDGEVTETLSYAALAKRVGAPGAWYNRCSHSAAIESES